MLQIRLLLGMLCASPWRYYPLTLQFLSQQHSALPKGEQLHTCRISASAAATGAAAALAAQAVLTAAHALRSCPEVGQLYTAGAMPALPAAGAGTAMLASAVVSSTVSR
jgi:hypothetical protein